MKLPPIAIALGLAGASLLAGQDLPQWVLSLAAVKRHMRAELERLPNYMCAETVERSERRNQASPFKQQTRLDLEVALVGGQEMLALGGASEFAEARPETYIREGAFTTGMFSALTRNLFVADNARTTGWGRESLDGREALRYDFEVTELFSGFHLTTDTGEATVGVRGSYWVDSSTLDLLRIEERAVDIPLTLLMSEVTETATYARTRIGASEVLLPSTATAVLTNLDGVERKNVITYAGCREYQSESTIRFVEPEKTTAIKKQ